MAKKLSEQEKKEKERKKQAKDETNARIFNLLFFEDELSWKDIIYKLIEDEHMDPWDIDVSLLSQKFLEMMQKLKELDFRISGKMVLASAILLKMKSDILIEQDIPNFDDMMNATEENLMAEENTPISYTDKPQIFPKSPQPRLRKISVYDLVNALEKALEVEVKRNKNKFNAKKIEMKIPEKKYDLGKSMQMVYDKVQKHYKKTKDKVLTFDELVLSDAKKDKVLTFVPLLHLDTQRKIDLEQEKHFDTIGVKLSKPEYNDN
ncbi:TPA: segregation/condensation protein A [Candidatus Woesearchaeota archaeon]|nr:segregation/condensation protein A [Candidatus Woesearchaeota archaeon]HIH32511.1 segregation/condensation protein A [Candidatus Woesearchaeota archaeon]HIH54153.1 segregation/condensation protein A [Candidatus Woesearchaeota archaeon]HIJ01694.1 segregation/condensation protein A [Candidatus Woesearchaeota archaeon]HIJ13266.1 segregation/condensation protein A [Candidatus Woesearchaeota archaeon]